MKVVIRWNKVDRPELNRAEEPRLVPVAVGARVRRAVLGPAQVARQEGDCVFPDGWSPALAAFEPEALVGSASTLRWMARAVRRGRVQLASVCHSVIAVVGETHGWLDETDRQLIQAAWGAPLFEQLWSPGGELLAAECTAHEGLHLASDLKVVPLGVEGYDTVDCTPCLCGGRAPRLLSSRTEAAPLALAAAGGR